MHLQAALIQAGPWAGHKDLKINVASLKGTLRNTIGAIDWEAAEDVRRFLRSKEAKSLGLWGERFFLAKLEKMVGA